MVFPTNYLTFLGFVVEVWLLSGYDFLDSVQELRELIYNVPLDKDRRNDRPLSKLTQDILEEIENL